MTKNLSRKPHSTLAGTSASLSRFAAAAAVYAGFAVYIYYPHFKCFNTLRLRDFFVINICLACMGCFVLSRRWISGFVASFFAGLIYGFGPFSLGLARYHPTVGLLAAAIPWLFCPAAFGPKAKWRWLSVPLSAMPFLAILAFFEASARWRLFAIPVHTRLESADLLGLLAPLAAASRGSAFIGFYHIPIAALLMGLSMLLAARRLGVMALFAMGTILAFCEPVFNTSPIIWFAIPALCCSIMIAEGMQGLTGAGFADRRWVLAIAIILAALSLAAVLAAKKYAAELSLLGIKEVWLFIYTAKMYALGAAASAVIYLMTRVQLRLGWVRLILLCSAMAVDIFLGARFIFDGVF